MSEARPLAAGLLAGRRVAVSGLGGGDGPVAARLSQLGAELLDADADGGRAPAPPVDALVHDAGPAFGAAGGGPVALSEALARAWAVVRAVAGEALAADGAGRDREAPEAIVLLAPPPGAGPFAGAAAAGLENLARSLSVEWARFAVTAVAVVPGGAAGESGALAELVAFLVSSAGRYVSGCRLSLTDRPLPPPPAPARPAS